MIYENRNIEQRHIKKQRIAIIIVDTEKARTKFHNENEYIPCIVKEDEFGYYLTDWRWGTDRAVAQKLADEYNTNLGLTKDDVMKLTLASMKPRRK